MNSHVGAILQIVPTGVFAAVTPSDSADLSGGMARIYVGGDGDVSVLNARGEAVVFAGAKAGSVLPIWTRRVRSTGTTATGIVALYRPA